MQKIKLEKLFYNNSWHKPKSKKIYRHVTHKGVNIEISNCNKLDVDISVKYALKSAEKYQNFTNLRKAKILENISNQIIKNSSILAQKESQELGKTFENAKKEIIACAKLWKHASNIIKKKKPKILKKGNTTLYEYMEPVGVVALIIPWNFPMIVLSERLPYILAAGNTVVIKPSETGSLSISYFFEILKKSALPKGVVGLITGDYSTGQHLVKHKDVSMISFTGSTATGKKIYNFASNTIKRLSLELGGKNPMVVFGDANLKKAADDIIHSFSHNAGQCCVSGSRLFIEKRVYNKFIKIFLDKINLIKFHQNITTDRQFQKIKKIISVILKSKIAVIYKSRELFDDSKRIIFPLIFKPLKKNKIFEKEIFGPVLSVYTFKNLDKLIKDMNDTNYGLSSLIWTSNKNKALLVASKLKSGRIWINGNISENYPEISIGGFKQSGLNRETGDSGLNTYSEIKSIVLNI